MKYTSLFKNQIAEINHISESELQDLTEIKDLLKTYNLIIINDINLDKEQLEVFAGKVGSVTKFGDWNNAESRFSTVQVVKKNNSERKAIGGWYYLDTNGFGDWHIDGVSSNNLYSHSVLHSKKIPGDLSGDTIFSFSPLAIKDLSTNFVNVLKNLNIVHVSRPVKNWIQEHFEREMQYFSFDSVFEKTCRPLVSTFNNVNGLYVSPSRAVKINEWHEEESNGIIRFLSSHVTRDEYCYRHRWKTNQILIWNNILSLHYPVNDYISDERELWRVCVNYDNFKF